MCGRLACGLEPEEICNSCSYKTSQNNVVKPTWKNFSNRGKSYRPSYNICPTEIAPVLLSGSHFDSDNRVVAPMIFGVIPLWNKAESSTKYSTINCRLETIKSSKLYGKLLEKGQRCVVICSGFYEWQNQNKGSKQPYFISCEQPSGVLIDDPSTWNLKDHFKEETNRFKPLKMAALFNRQCSEEGELTFSFTIITREASSKMTWLHSRMPFFIDSDEQLDIWLNSKNIDADQALACFTFSENVIWNTVSSLVNKTSNKIIDCIRKSSQNESKSSASLMKIWLEKGQKRINQDEDDLEKLKKRK